MAKKAAKRKKPKPPPTCKAILLCDTVLVDARTRKMSLIGVFHGFRVTGLPGQSPPFDVYLQLVNGIGAYGLTIQIEDLEKGIVLAKSNSIHVDFPDRHRAVEFFIPFQGLQLPHPGAYDFVILADDQEIDRQQVRMELHPGLTDGKQPS